MATEVIHEHSGTGSDNGVGFILGVVLLLAFILLMFYFIGNGAFNSFGLGGGSTNVQVPDKVDVNVQGQGGN